MEILYIYKDYMRRRKKYGEMMEKCGHKVRYLLVKNKDKKNQISNDCLKKKPQIVWFQNTSYVKNNPIFIDHVKSLGIPIVVYYTLNPQESYAEKKWMDTWKRIDYLFIHNKEFHKFLKSNNFNSYYMPIGFFTDQYYKTINKKIFNISFCGTDLTRENRKKDKRAKYIRSLEKYNIVVYGQGFKNKVGKIKVHSYRTHKKQRNIYGESKINLDLPFFNTPYNFYKKGYRQYHIKNRFFEIPATCNFLLTVRCPEFLDIFPEDTVGYYDDNIESLKDSVKRYLKDSKLRKKMTERAYKLVYQKHTFLHRFKKMFKIIGI